MTATPTDTDAPGISQNMDGVMHETPQAAIINAIASVRAVGATEMCIQLQSVVDVDTLESLAGHDDLDWTLDFDFDGHDVTVDGSGTVVVDDTTFVDAFSA